MDLRDVSALGSLLGSAAWRVGSAAWLVGSAVSLMVGCAPATPASEHAILDGTIDEGDPAVAAVLTWSSSCGEPARVVCSGVLIAPRIVLTAGHCVDDVLRAGQGGVFFGASLAAGGEHIAVIRGRAHPGWDGESAVRDLGVLVLARAPAVAPIAISAHRVDELTAGAVVRVVGFGVSSLDAIESDGVKREGTMTLGPIAETLFASIPGPASSCRIDSGGPVLAMFADGEALIGITAAGDARCVERADNARVEVALAELITPEIERVASEPDPRIDPALLAGLCSALCDGDADCPAPMRCERLIDGPRCVLATNGPGAYGDACSNDIECRAQPCVRLAASGDDACRCFAACGGMVMPPLVDAGMIAPPTDGGSIAPPSSSSSCSASAGGDARLALSMLAAFLFARLGRGLTARRSRRPACSNRCRW